MLKGFILLHPPQLWFDGVRQTLEELVAVTVKRHLARLHQISNIVRRNVSAFDFPSIVPSSDVPHSFCGKIAQ